jgi:hypothetical protein
LQIEIARHRGQAGQRAVLGQAAGIGDESAGAVEVQLAVDCRDLAAGELQQRIALQIDIPGLNARGAEPGRAGGDIQRRQDAGVAHDVDHAGVVERLRRHRVGGADAAATDVERVAVGAVVGQRPAYGQGAAAIATDIDARVEQHPAAASDGQAARGGDQSAVLQVEITRDRCGARGRQHATRVELKLRTRIDLQRRGRSGRGQRIGTGLDFGGIRGTRRRPEAPVGEIGRPAAGAVPVIVLWRHIDIPNSRTIFCGAANSGQSSDQRNHISGCARRAATSILVVHCT